MKLDCEWIGREEMVQKIGILSVCSEIFTEQYMLNY